MSKYPEVYKVIGAPGTGKTTRVVGNPELDLKGLFIEEMENGYPIEEQMLVTYTNAGVDEAADRLYRMLDESKNTITNRVTTIHSRSFQLADLSRDDVVNSYDKRQFCNKMGLEYGWDSDDADDIMASEDTKEGNALFDLYGWLQSNRVAIDNWEDCPADWPGQDDPEYLMREWEVYKAHNGLVGFGDMIERVVHSGLSKLKDEGLISGEVNIDNEMEKLNEARNHIMRSPDQLRGEGPFVDTKVMYVDEVQDLTPLQWEWYLLQKLVCEKVYLGGDDDQTIYGWAGANPDFMLEEEGEFEVLDRTYRIPEEVWEVCNRTIQQVEKRQEKEVTPDGDGGDVVELHRPPTRRVTEYIQDSDDVFILFRARYMIDEFCKKLNSQGIPYENISTFDTWEDDVVNIRDAFATLQNGDGKLSHDELEALKDNIPNKCINESNVRSGKQAAFDKFGGLEQSVVEDTFTFKPVGGTGKLTLRQYLEHSQDYDDGLNYYQCNAIKGNIRNNNEDMYPERVRIGTIHSSKGKEADTVILATDSTQTIMTQMMNETKYDPEKEITDAERRVYYVGMTRASRRLVLAQGLVNPDMAIPIEHLTTDSVSSKQADLSSEWA